MQIFCLCISWIRDIFHNEKLLIFVLYNHDLYPCSMCFSKQFAPCLCKKFKSFVVEKREERSLKCDRLITGDSQRFSYVRSKNVIASVAKQSPKASGIATALRPRNDKFRLRATEALRRFTLVPCQSIGRNVRFLGRLPGKRLKRSFRAANILL